MADADIATALASANAALLEGSPASAMEAVAQFQRAADAGSGEALARLAGLLASGVSGPADWDKSIELLQRAASLGVAQARDEVRLLTGAGGQVDIRALVAPRSVTAGRASPRIRVFKGFCTPAECDWIVTRASNRLKRASVYANANEESLVVRERTNTEAVFGPAELDVAITFIRARLAHSIRAPLHHFEPALALHYATGQHFAPHFDFLDPAIAGHTGDLARRGQRVATALLYLNDDFDGGETDFPALGWRFRGDVGDLLVFDNVDATGAPDRRTFHAGLPPTRGEKWLLSQWVRDRPQS
jgi:prolyl 4-hydroxylase